jgi:hypothetical protein
VGAGADVIRRPVSHPRSSNRTCGFPASGFPTDFVVDSRSSATGRTPEPEHARSKGPSLHQRYPASSVLTNRPPYAPTCQRISRGFLACLRPTLSDTQMVRRPLRRRRGTRPPQPSRASPTDADYHSGVLCSLPRWTESVHDGYRDGALPRRIGIHIAAFGACSNFTRVTARRIARPPFVDFVARFRPARLPESAARQLSNLTINYSSGSFPTGNQPL